MDAQLADLLNNAGLGDLLGGSKQSNIIASILSKKKPQYRKDDAKPLDINRMSQSSKFLQERYGNEEDEIKPFDYCKAQRLREEREANKTPEERHNEAVHTPEYWGQSYDEMEKVGRYWVNKDGLRYPPIKWTNKADGKTYWGLACCGATAEGYVNYTRGIAENRLVGFRGSEPKYAKTKFAPRKKQRYGMLYFRADDMPKLSELPEFGQSISYAIEKPERRKPTDPDDGRMRHGAVAHYKGVVIKKVYKGITLIGTDRVKARSDPYLELDVPTREGTDSIVLEVNKATKGNRPSEKELLDVARDGAFRDFYNKKYGKSFTSEEILRHYNDYLKGKIGRDGKPIKEEVAAQKPKEVETLTKRANQTPMRRNPKDEYDKVGVPFEPEAPKRRKIVFKIKPKANQINLKSVDDMATKDVLIEANLLHYRADTAKKIEQGLSRHTPKEMGTSIGAIRQSLKSLRQRIFGKSEGVVEMPTQKGAKEGETYPRYALRPASLNSD